MSFFVASPKALHVRYVTYYSYATNVRNNQEYLNEKNSLKSQDRKEIKANIFAPSSQFAYRTTTLRNDALVGWCIFLVDSPKNERVSPSFSCAVADVCNGFLFHPESRLEAELNSP